MTSVVLESWIPASQTAPDPATKTRIKMRRGNDENMILSFYSHFTKIIPGKIIKQKA
jgi:hypothetical protein